MTPSCPRLTLLAVLGACQGPASGSSGFSSTPEITTVSAGTTDTAPMDSTGPAAESSTTAGSTSSESGVGETTTQPVLDLGTMPDLGDGTPVGCQGKIDLLFVISRSGLMESRQAQLVKAFPKFIETIEAKFDDFDYHIMVIDGDDEWGSYHCTNDCPVLDCKIGDKCCEINTVPPEEFGKPCCGVPEAYPCGYLDVLPDCELTMGAGTLFPAGDHASNKLCPIDGGRRYMVKGQTDLEGTFACVGKVGINGRGQLGEALTAAMQKSINDPGGCNAGFLRNDALLMVTFIQTNPDEGGGGLDSEGYAQDWAKAVLDAKHGDPESVVMLTFAYPNWDVWDEIYKLVKMFPYNKVDDTGSDDYGTAFAEAASLVETACAGYVAPG